MVGTSPRLLDPVQNVITAITLLVPKDDFDTKYHQNVTKRFITARKRSCGKVMFLHLSVILFTGGVSTSGCGGCLPLVPGGLPLGLGGYTPRADTPPVEITIEAGGTHPTGMHSCLSYHQYLSEYVQKYNAERSFVDLIRHILAELPIAKNQSIK